MGEFKKNLYGRRKGPALSARQEQLVENLLPQLMLNLQTPPDPLLQNLFTCQMTSHMQSDVKDIWLEIGFGGGEHLAWQAAQNPDKGFIGCEPFLNGMAKLLVQIEEQELQNIRLYDSDARFVLDWLPSSSLGRVFILFPDPWHKKRHHKRRFINHENLDRLARVMRPGAQLRLASDIGDYIRTSLLAIQSHPDFIWLDEGPGDWCHRRDDWPPTRYEQKAIVAGRKPVYLTFMRKISKNGM